MPALTTLSRLYDGLAGARDGLAKQNIDTVCTVLRHGLGLQDRDMKALDIDLERINAGDRDSARKREAAVGDKTTRNLAYLIVLGGGVMIGCTLAGFTKVDSVLAGTLIGYAVSEMKQVLTYYFGSSAGSKDKDNTLAEIAKQP